MKTFKTTFRVVLNTRYFAMDTDFKIVKDSLRSVLYVCSVLSSEMYIYVGGGESREESEKGCAMRLGSELNVLRP